MQASRRTFTLGALMALASGCGGGAARFETTPVRREPSMPSIPNAGWDAWVAAFKGRAVGQGISQGVIDQAFRNAGFLPGVIERDRNQTEFKRSLEDYLSIAASDERVAKGRSNYAAQRTTLSQIEARYGVEGHVVAAIWGLESFFGERRGTIPIVSSTSTLAYEGRRGAFFEKQLIAALKILQNGDTTYNSLVGSWAGAMGHTQFIPTSYELFAVDFTGDGRRDIWSDDPTDSLASTAAYLAKSGWIKGQSWGGQTGTPGANIPGQTLQPEPGGPTFTVGRNFAAIKRYNNSDAYAIGVGHLSDRILGGAPITGPFPPDRYGMRKDDRIALQKGLTRAGFDTQGADGVIGPNSRAAISAFQARNRLSVTGDPSLDLLRRL